MEKEHLLDIVAKYHGALPDRIRRYLNDRGVPDGVIDTHLLGWNGSRITIPIFDRKGEVTSFKLAKDPDDRSRSPKMMASPGATAELYGWGSLAGQPAQITICEGEFDGLVLEAQGLKAVTSTGGAGTFRREWAKEFEGIPEVYVCFDRDEAGRKGAERVGRLIRHAKIVELPEEVGEGGDVTDFFVRLGRSREDFERLLTEAKPMPDPPPAPIEALPRSSGVDPSSPLRQRIERLKSEVPIEHVVSRYVTLQESGGNLVGLCPFHDDHVPSLTVYPRTGTFYCFGCGKRGDVITFIREIEHLGFGQALDRLEGL